MQAKSKAKPYKEGLALLFAQTSNGVNKKIIWLIILLVLFILFGFYLYKYLFNNDTGKVFPIQQTEQTNQKEEKSNVSQQSDVKIENQGIKAEGTNGGGSLTICSYECGNGICQTTDPNCKNGNLNCICPETHEDCPQDCK